MLKSSKHPLRNFTYFKHGLFLPPEVTCSSRVTLDSGAVQQWEEITF